MSEAFSRVAILGLGLMGGSLALALREGKLAQYVVGFDIAPDAAGLARERGAIDEECSTPSAAVGEADLVVMAVPVLAVRDLMQAIAPHLTPTAIVTDLSSTKSAVCGWAADLLPDPSRFVGGHPMAGREHSGIQSADSMLYRGAVWCLTPGRVTDPAATRRLSDLVTTIGASPLELDAHTHDHLVAGISHLPLLAATALLRATSGSAAWNEMGRLAAGGFRDTTRVASGDPVMARDICLTNGAAIAEWLATYTAELEHLRMLIMRGDAGALFSIFQATSHARTEWAQQRQPE